MEPVEGRPRGALGATVLQRSTAKRRVLNYGGFYAEASNPNQKISCTLPEPHERPVRETVRLQRGAMQGDAVFAGDSVDRRKIFFAGMT
jgi:hypothetical protein